MIAMSTNSRANRAVLLGLVGVLALT
ncbi:MAG: hypothetical protein QOE41_2191, partial [Mycobacterium sp.]|nr:hypothetical protein [Mycobacterium sp.]